MKIVFFAVKPWEKKYLTHQLKAHGVKGQVLFIDKKLTRDTIPAKKDFEIASVFVDSQVTDDVIDRLPKLKFITARSTGFDNIDQKKCKKRGIKVSYVPSYGEVTVAEYAFALLLSLSRKIYEGYDRIRESANFSVEGLTGFDLFGKTLGVVGTGRIGKNSVRIGQGFGMKVIAYDPFPDKAYAKIAGFPYMSLEKVLKNSDVVTLHTPYMKETHHLMNKKTIGMMKKGAYLINTSRGAVVETESLVEALRSGHLGGAGLDVLEEEGVIMDELNFVVDGHPEEHNLRTVLADHVLVDMPNVIITPHNAFNSHEALERILNTTVENIKGFLDGKPVNLVKI